MSDDCIHQGTVHPSVWIMLNHCLFVLASSHLLGKYLLITYYVSRIILSTGTHEGTKQAEISALFISLLWFGLETWDRMLRPLFLCVECLIVTVKLFWWDDQCPWWQVQMEHCFSTLGGSTESKALSVHLIVLGHFNPGMTLLNHHTHMWPQFLPVWKFRLPLFINSS